MQLKMANIANDNMERTTDRMITRKGGIAKYAAYVTWSSEKMRTYLEETPRLQEI